MHEILQRLASVLPVGLHREANRLRHGWQIRHSSFRDDTDPFFERLDDILAPGDWAIDVGANVGHYTLRLSDLVGASGRVIAVEPIPYTFELLCANARRARHNNISLLNIACSNAAGVVGMNVPMRPSGIPNYYTAQIADGAPHQVLCLPLDALPIPTRVNLLKIDAEGHDLMVIRGAEKLIARDHPAILVEGAAAELDPVLRSLGYINHQAPSWSPNRFYTFERAHA